MTVLKFSRTVSLVTVKNRTSAKFLEIWQKFFKNKCILDNSYFKGCGESENRHLTHSQKQNLCMSIHQVLLFFVTTFLLTVTFFLP